MQVNMDISADVEAINSRSNSIKKRISRILRSSIDLSIENRDYNITASSFESSKYNHTLLKDRIRYKHKNSIKKERSLLYFLGDHIIDMFDQSLKQCNATEIRYKRLDQITRAALYIKTRDLDKLNLQIKRLEEKSIHQIQLYKDLKIYHQNSINKFQEKCKEIKILHTQLSACEQSTYITVTHYATELEKERLGSRKLTFIIQKQQETIASLENKLNSFPLPVLSRKPKGNGSYDLIKALVDLQSMELDDKKNLLSTLIDEREELLKKIEILSNSNSSVISTHKEEMSVEKYKDRSSIDMLIQIAKPIIESTNQDDSGTILFYSRKQSIPPLPPHAKSVVLRPKNQLKISNARPNQYNSISFERDISQSIF